MIEVPYESRRFEEAMKYSSSMKDSVAVYVLQNTASDFECVTMSLWTCLGRKSKYVIYRLHLHDDNPESTHSTLGAGEVSIGEWPVDEVIDAMDAFIKAAKGFVRCHHCGEWVRYEDARRYVPAGVVCKKPECMKHADESEHDFYSMPLD